MKTIIFVLLMMGSALAQNLTPDQQKKMLDDMRVMKERLDQLEKNKAPVTSGLKTTNYKDATSETNSPGGASPGEESAPALTADQSKKLMDDIAVLKKNQADSQKILDEMENEDNQ